MRKLLALVAVLGVASPAAAQVAFNGNDSSPKNINDCSSGGSSAVALTRGTYLLTVTDETTFVCFAASSSTCASNGRRLPAGTVMLVQISSDQLSVSCRSASSGGDLSLIPASG